MTPEPEQPKKKASEKVVKPEVARKSTIKPKVNVQAAAQAKKQKAAENQPRSPLNRKGGVAGASTEEVQELRQRLDANV